MKPLVLVIALTLFAGCATTPETTPDTVPAVPDQEPAAAPDLAAERCPKGTVEIDVTDILGNERHSIIELRPAGAKAREVIKVDVPEGRLRKAVPAGRYECYIYVVENGFPVLIEAQGIDVAEGGTCFVPVSLLEGTSGNKPLSAFDQDNDLVLDRVELAWGTDPQDAADVPGRKRLSFDNKVVSEDSGWYKGDLHVHSVYGRPGGEPVGRLISRAEKMGLDFLAITDRNTMAACKDESFKSDSVVLIPAMEWGADETGIALIYAPRTFPEPAATVPEAQGVCVRVQAQGGIFALAHPCFPTAPWQLRLAYVNAVEVWCRPWRSVPPMSLQLLSEPSRRRHDGKFVYPIAVAAATTGLSANGQAAVFWDEYIERGFRACAIAGSGSASSKVPMAEPVTYVYAEQKSTEGILDGLRSGRTFVSAGIDGPRLRFIVDVLGDDSVDVNIGGVIPLNVDSVFNVAVENAKGKKVQVLFEGKPIITKVIESGHFSQFFPQTPQYAGAYRVRVIDTPDGRDKGFGPIEVLAMTSPIYAANIARQLLLDTPGIDPSKMWMEVPHQTDWLPAPPSGGSAPPPLQPEWRY